MTKITQYYLIEDGPMAGVILEPIFATLAVKYPHRKTKDLYVPPMKDAKRGKKSYWHCCQPDCPNPEFKGGLEELIEHLKLHAGRFLKKSKGGQKDEKTG